MMTVYFNDPAGVKNQYRFVMYVNGKEVNTIFAFDDQFIDGKHVTLDLQQNETDIYPGDTVRVEMQNIDRPVYIYWFTLEQQQGNNPGGAVAPSNPPTNITPATLGYFSAHTTQSLSIIARWLSEPWFVGLNDLPDLAILVQITSSPTRDNTSLSDQKGHTYADLC